MFKLTRFLKPYKKQVILGPVFKLFEAILELLIPLLMVRIIDVGVKNNNVPYITKMGGLMIGIALLGVCSSYVCQYYASIASQGVGTNIRNAIFEKIESFSFAEIDKVGTPSLVNRIVSDVNQLQFAVAMLIRLVVRVPFLCAGGIIMAMAINLKLSIILFIMMPIFALIIYFIMSKTVPLYKQAQKKLDSIGVVARENLSGVRVIRAFAKIDKERRRFKKVNNEYATTSIKVGKISALLNPATTVVINLAIAGVLWYGGVQVNVGGMTQGEIIAYVNYINIILSSLIIVANLVITFTKAEASANRVNEIFNTIPSIVDFEEEVALTRERINEDSPIIEFKDVSFSYNKVTQEDNLASQYTLKNISFKIKRGQTVGIIGATGSGKTTLISLLARFYDVTKGKILINGVDLRNLKQEDLRMRMGIVQQKAVLFTGTVSENIRWGNENASDEEVILASKIAQAHEFVEKLEKGYATKLSQGGVNLSGGQKQRLAIARAMVRKPEILILDDSSSALDYATDAALRRELHKNTKNMTTIMVAQRVATVKKAEVIIVLDDGEIAGIGNNEQLLLHCEVYKEIYNSQQGNGVKA